MRPDYRSANAPELHGLVQLRPRRPERSKFPRRPGFRTGALKQRAATDRTEECATMANPAPGYAKKPEHRVDLLPETRRVRVVFNGVVIADSTSALRCEETGHEPVHYIPEKDIRLDLMRPTDHKSYCPFKGDCLYW